MQKNTSEKKWYEKISLFFLEFVWEALARAFGAVVGFILRLF